MYCNPCFSQNISEILPEIYDIEKCDFFQTYYTVSNIVILCYIGSLSFCKWESVMPEER